MSRRPSLPPLQPLHDLPDLPDLPHTPRTPPPVEPPTIHELDRQLHEQRRERNVHQLMSLPTTPVNLPQVHSPVFGEDRSYSIINHRALPSHINPADISVKPIEDTKTCELLNRITCKVCYINEIDTVLNCGHMFCGRCVETIVQGDSKCPECRTPITSKIKNNYNKYVKYKNKYMLLKKAYI